MTRIVNPDGSAAEGAWHLDRKVPVAIIGALLMQTMALGWWASKLDSRVESLERADQRFDTRIEARFKVGDDRWEAIGRDRDRIIRLEEQTRSVVEIVRRIETKLDHAVSREPAR